MLNVREPLSSLCTGGNKCWLKSAEIKADSVVTDSWPEDLTGQTDGCAQPRRHFSSFLSFLRYYCHTGLEHVSPLCTTTKMPAEATGSSTPTHVRTRTFQCSSTHLRGRGQTRHWTHAPRDIWGNAKPAEGRSLTLTLLPLYLIITVLLFYFTKHSLF